MLRTSTLVLALSCSLFAACRDDDGGGNGGVDGGGQSGDGGPIASDVTIQEIQADAMAAGTQVSVKGVVVTAIDTFGNRTGDLFVQEPGGGAFSGIKVFGAPLEQVALLAVGDVVDISSAVKDEFALMDDMTGRTVTELKPVEGGTMVITKMSTGTVPAPATVDAVALAAMDRATREAEYEKWEGVLISLTNARQTRAISTFGSSPGPDSTEFRTTGFARVQSALTELPAATSVLGTCYASITGVGDYFFNDLLMPRSAADLVTGGTGCLPLATSVVAIQTSTVVPELVNLTNVFVTARDDIGGNKGFWVADALQGAASNGVYVYTGNTGAATNPALPPDAALVIGARVSIVGSVDEFDLGAMGAAPVGDTVTEVVNPIISGIMAPGAAPTPATTATAGTLATIGAAGEPWEGVLVRLSNVKVTNNNAGSGKVELTDTSGMTVLADDESFAFSPQASPVVVGTCYSTFTGVMHVQINDDVRTINPRNAGDIVVASNPNACNPI